MFTNPGKKLKGFSRFLFWLSVVGTLILASVFGSTTEEVGYIYTRTETVFHPEIFFTILIVGLVFSYVEALCLYGFGELIENSAKSHVLTNVPTVLEDIETNLPNL